MADLGTAVTTWSLGFQETEPGVWKVNRISPVSIPQGILALPGGLPPTDESHLGLNDGIGIPRSRQGNRRRSMRAVRKVSRGQLSSADTEPARITNRTARDTRIASRLLGSRGQSLDTSIAQPG